MSISPADGSGADFAVLIGQLPSARPAYIPEQRLARGCASGVRKLRARAPQQRPQGSLTVLTGVLADDRLERLALRMCGLVQVPVVFGRPEVEIRFRATREVA